MGINFASRRFLLHEPGAKFTCFSGSLCHNETAAQTAINLSYEIRGDRLGAKSHIAEAAGGAGPLAGISGRNQLN